MDYKFLSVRRDGLVEHVVLNRPDVRNAFNAEMIGELTAWAGGFVRPSDARGVVLAGSGKGFCAGADAAGMGKTATDSETEDRRGANAPSAVLRALAEPPLPL